MDGIKGNKGLPQPHPIPDHELIKCIGRGSYGHVWLARNVMGVYRAIKIVEKSSFKSERPYRRELEGIQKYEPISRSHPGLAAVLHVGMHDGGGSFYYVMELADDVQHGQNIDPSSYQAKTLGSLAHNKECLGHEECAQIGSSLSAALRHLHEQGLIHRDIKPANILFINGYPKLADIGLVTDLGGANSFVGTEGFIPPEGPNSIQADIYSFGKTLYEMVTGLDRHEFPSLPDHWHLSENAQHYLELNAIITKACHNHLASRYPSFREMQADLTALANGASIRRLHSLESKFKVFKRFFRVATLFFVVVGFLGYSGYREHQIRVEQRTQILAQHMARGTRYFDEKHSFKALPEFSAILEYSEGSEGMDQNQRLRMASAVMQSPTLTVLRTAITNALDVLLTAKGEFYCYTDSVGNLNVVPTNPSLHHRVYRPHDPGLILCMDDSADGRFLATGGTDSTVRILDVQDGALVAELLHPDTVTSVEFVHDGKGILSGCQDGSARLWNWTEESKEPVFELRHEESVDLALFNPKRNQIITIENHGKVWVWDVGSQRKIGTSIFFKADRIHDCAISPDGNRLAIGVSDYSARVLDLDTRSIVLPLLKHDHRAVCSVDFSPDGQFILTASFDHTVRMWDALTGELLPPVLPHSSMLNSAKFGLNGRVIVSSCVDGTIRMWDMAGSSPGFRLKPKAMSSNGESFLIYSNQMVHAGSMRNPSDLTPLPIHLDQLKQCILDPAGQYVAASHLLPAEKAIRITILPLQDKQTNPLGFTAPIGTELMELSLQGRFLIARREDLVVLYDGAQGKELWTYKNDNDYHGSVFSENLDRVVLYDRRSVHILNSLTGARSTPPLSDFNYEVHHVAMDPASRLLVVCESDESLEERQAFVHHLANGKRLRTLHHGDGVLKASFTHNGDQFVTGSEDGTAVVRDGASLESKFLLQQGHRVNDVRFVNQDRWILTVGGDRHARLWDAKTGIPLSPMIEFPFRPKQGWLLSDSQRLVVQMEYTDVVAYVDVPVLDWTREDLELYARLLASFPPDGVFGAGALRQWYVESWHRLRNAHPQRFDITEAQIFNWHDHQALRSYTHDNWGGELFHAEILCQMKPGESYFEGRRDRARKFLTSQIKD